MTTKVEYLGSADTVRISKEQWKAAGVESADATWTRAERVQEIADAAAEYLLAKDRRFGKPGSRPATGPRSTPDQTPPGGAGGTETSGTPTGAQSTGTSGTAHPGASGGAPRATKRSKGKG